MKKEVTLASAERCTGCGACANICPKQAIEMVPDQEGFIQPVIHEELCVACGKCEAACPVLHPSYHNDTIHSSYAMWASDELRAKTSTAGMFLLAAKHILNQSGVVYGAAWKEGWYVHHVGIDREEDLPQIVGSKYLQSDVEHTYQEAKRNLEAGRPVLYSGCPCQIAGLYAYLGKEKDANLTTIELICHGVPSPAVFHKYLHDNFGEREISEILFRDKKVYGWSTTTTVRFKSGNPYRKNERMAPYLQAFLPCMILRKSCSVCPFSRRPRQADLSIGDFWGIDRKDKTWNDRRGTELVLLNNERGRRLWEDMKPSFQRWEQFPLEVATRVNANILAPFHMHPGRKHFFSSMKIKPFNELVEASLKHNYDIGVVGLWYGINYGSILTYYALYQLLRDMGYDPVMLPKPANLWNEKYNDKDSIAQKFIWRHCNVFAPYPSQNEYYRANDRCKDFIIGSDVVWNYGICGKDTDQFFFLDWVESGHKKIAYAASFGNSLSGDLQYKEKAKYHLQKFDAVSIRESSGVEQAIRESGRDDIVHVLDPVFVCNVQTFRDAANECRDRETQPFVFAYLLNRDLSDLKLGMIDRLRTLHHANARICGNPNSISIIRDHYGSQVMPEISVEQWLYYMMNCSYYIGDSYHGMCFALIFHRPFLALYKTQAKGSSIQRFESLLKLVGLEERLVSKAGKLEDYEELLTKEIDWEEVDRRLNASRETSRNWLKAALEKEIASATGADYVRDAEKRKLYECGALLEKQNKQIEELTRRLDEEMERRETISRRLMKKLKAALRCWQDHGFSYTMKHMWDRFIER
ncbi:MAG: polysaccharide pyruvyl transferase family protein [Clostridiales bacterium]|nr:polysaccharide pyruvyl transferase family protein [Clostridiales bacterium]